MLTDLVVGADEVGDAGPGLLGVIRDPTIADAWFIRSAPTDVMNGDSMRNQPTPWSCLRSGAITDLLGVVARGPVIDSLRKGVVTFPRNQ